MPFLARPPQQSWGQLGPGRQCAPSESFHLASRSLPRWRSNRLRECRWVTSPPIPSFLLQCPAPCSLYPPHYGQLRHPACPQRGPRRRRLLHPSRRPAWAANGLGSLSRVPDPPCSRLRLRGPAAGVSLPAHDSAADVPGNTYTGHQVAE